jgi:ABC-type sugar transport system permease subunit
MKSLKKDQGGFFTMIALLLAILIAVIVFVYLRVTRTNG